MTANEQSGGYLRCIVKTWDEKTIVAETMEGQLTEIDYGEHQYLRKMLREGMQLNVLDDIIVVEPDFLVDISAVARCFQDNYGHHPLLYTVGRLRPRGNSQAMLLGNFAGAALDDVINGKEYRLADTLNKFFREQAMQFSTCKDFNGSLFLDDARRQSENIEEAVEALFGKDYEREKALLEPTFVCEQLGLQGRVDLMTSDMRLLVEQKSGKNYGLERQVMTRQQPSAMAYKEEHYVQLLLYYGILRYNFGLADNQVDIRLLYSRYPAARGLIHVGFYRNLFREAIRLRNQIVATEMLIAREGFGRILPLLTADVIYRGAERDGYFHRFIEPPLATLTLQLSALNATERAYYERMMSFVYREQLLQKVRRDAGQGDAASDLWNMSLAEKIEMGNIILSDQPSGALNFRRGDMIYLYNYEGDEPDVRKAILYKGTLECVDGSGVEVRLNEGVSADTIMQQGKWAIEHAGSDQNTTSAIKSLHQFVCADKDRKALLLGLRQPVSDTSQTLTRSYHKDYDDVLLKTKQARDYYLLVGPPGTGKTSMALRFLVAEELACSPQSAILLTAYTNRAVDEICAMLEEAGTDYMRIGNETSCDPRFIPHLFESLLGEKPKLDDIRRCIKATPVVVGTTSMFQAYPFIFQLKYFSLCIVDEASQILEPGLVGILSSDSISRFILVGDHKQLPAVVQQSEQESQVTDPLLTAIGITDCRHSLFERLLKWERCQGRKQFVGILRKQGRMHPDIAAFPNDMFYHSEQLEPVPLEHQLEDCLGYDLPSQDAIDDALKQHRVMFIDSELDETNWSHKAHESHDLTLSDKTNPVEARITADLLRRIYRFYGSNFDAGKTVGVIVPYRNQINMIREEIEKLNLPGLAAISIDTVERYQGSQRDVIVYSFTINHPYQLEFLTANCFFEKLPDAEGGSHSLRVIDRKLNVAITRARKQLLMTGKKQILWSNEIFRQLIARYQKKIY